LAHGAPAGMRAEHRPVPPAPPPPGQGAAGQWPLRSFLELGALPGAVPCARLHARELMWEWGLKGLCDDVEILVSEIITNALAASQSMARGLPVRLWLLCDKARVLIVVWDGCPQAPVRIDADGEAESGRGLLLVETISDQWGSYPTPATGGKAVWAVTVAGS
jgi:anti-sigma regulatory factor (Ser/Thr protein kinase)